MRWTIWFVDTWSWCMAQHRKKFSCPCLPSHLKFEKCIYICMSKESINCWRKKSSFIVFEMQKDPKKCKLTKCTRKKSRKKYINVSAMVNAMRKKKHFFKYEGWASVVCVGEFSDVNTNEFITPATDKPKIKEVVMLSFVFLFEWKYILASEYQKNEWTQTTFWLFVAT